MSDGTERQLDGATAFVQQAKKNASMQIVLASFGLIFFFAVISLQPQIFKASVTVMPGTGSWNSNPITEFVLVNKNHPLYQGPTVGDAYITYGNIETLFSTLTFLDFIERDLIATFTNEDKLCDSDSNGWRRILLFWKQKCHYFIDEDGDKILLKKNYLQNVIRFERRFKSQVLTMSVLSDDPTVAERYLKISVDRFAKFYFAQVRLDRSAENKMINDLIIKISDVNIKENLFEKHMKKSTETALSDIADLNMFQVIGDFHVDEADKRYSDINLFFLIQLLFTSIFLVFISIKAIFSQ